MSLFNKDIIFIQNGQLDRWIGDLPDIYSQNIIKQTNTMDDVGIDKLNALEYLVKSNYK